MTGAVLVIRHVVGLDWAQYSVWDTGAHRNLATSIMLGFSLLLGAAALVYAAVYSGRALMRDKAIARRRAMGLSTRRQKAALTLSPSGFKHWAARPTRGMVVWSDVGHWTVTKRGITISLAGRPHLDGQVMSIPFADIDAERHRITAAFEGFCGRPPSD